MPFRIIPRLHVALALLVRVQLRSLRGLDAQAEVIVVLVADSRQRRDGSAVAGDRLQVRGAQRLHHLLLLRRQVAEIALEAVGHTQLGGHHRGGTQRRDNGGDQQCSCDTAGLFCRRASALLFLNFFHCQLLYTAEVGCVVGGKLDILVGELVHQIIDIVFHAAPPFSVSS